MSEEIKAKVRKIYEDAHGKGNLDVLDELVAVDYVRNQPPMKQVQRPVRLQSVYRGCPQRLFGV